MYFHLLLVYFFLPAIAITVKAPINAYNNINVITIKKIEFVVYNVLNIKALLKKYKLKKNKTLKSIKILLAKKNNGEISIVSMFCMIIKLKL